MKPATKLRRYLDRPTTTSKHTPFVYRELYSAGYELERTGKYETFVSDIANVLSKCGFAVTEKGIGWEVTI